MERCEAGEVEQVWRWEMCGVGWLEMCGVGWLEM